MIDFLIVGQGIAGVCFAHEAMGRGYSVLCLNHPEEAPVSRIAAGIINPVTGRRLVKTWRAEEVISSAARFYSILEERLGKRFVAQRRILMRLDEQLVHEMWLTRSADISYKSYLGKISEYSDNQCIRGDIYGIIDGALQVDLDLLISASLEFFEEQGVLESGVFEYNTLSRSIHGSTLTCFGRQFRHIVFCEGNPVRRNPLFQWLPHTYAKGEVLICDIPGFDCHDIVKDGLVIAPLHNGSFWVGSNYDWNNEDDDPTEQARKTLESKLKRAISCNYRVTDHKAGVRPASRDRRPFAGTHPGYSNVHVINGLGAKGTSLAPYCAGLLLDSIVEGSELPREMDILRYYPS